MEKLDFGTAFKYPFNRFVGLFNILWVLLPIFGWFALGGYQVRLVKEWLEGKYTELPKFSFFDDMKLGFIIFLKLIPLLIVSIGIGLLASFLLKGVGSAIMTVVYIFIIPVLVINLFKKETISSSFEFGLVKVVFNNFIDYILMLIWSIVLGIVFAIMSIILIGIPANAFTKNIFLADWFRRNVKN